MLGLKRNRCADNSEITVHKVIIYTTKEPAIIHKNSSDARWRNKDTP